MTESVITNKGKMLLAKMLSSNGKGVLRITRVAFGVGTHTGEYDPEEMEALLDYKMDSGISRCESDGDTANVTVQITPQMVKENFLATEIGIFARENVEGAEEILYAYIDMAEDAQYIYAEGEEIQKLVEITISVIVSNVGNVIANIHTEGIIYREEFDAAKKEIGEIGKQTADALGLHTTNTQNPHKVTKAQVDLGNVDNTSDADKPVSVAQQAALDALQQLLEQGLEAHENDTSNPHKVSRVQLRVDKVDNTSDVDKPVSVAQQAALDELYQQMTAYTLQKIADLINGAPESMDTLKEVSDAIAANRTVMDALDAAIGKKANAAEFDSHVKDTTAHITASERTNWNDANNKKHTHNNKSVLDGITSALINGWNSAVAHVSDTVKHITAAERTKWNGKADNTNMTAATASVAGKAGLVPAPAVGTQNNYLTGAGTWQSVDDHAVTFSSGDAPNPTGWADIVLVAR